MGSDAVLAWARCSPIWSQRKILGESARATFQLQNELIYPKVFEHLGRRVKLMGEASRVRRALNPTNRHREPPA